MGKKIKNTADWHTILSNSITTADQLAEVIPVDKDEVQKVIEKYPMRINAYFLHLIEKGDPCIWKQAVPDAREINNISGMPDPLSEESQSPVQNLIHRYPDRVVFLISSQCAVYCRFCMRKRMIGNQFSVTDDTIAQGIEYIKTNTLIREVILSGGDPLLLEDKKIEEILSLLRETAHIEIIRIHTRAPGVLPQRITENLTRILKKFHPVFINTHFNHPDEITPEAEKACGMLADAGIPLGCQTVLLKDINNNKDVMERLMRKLLRIRVKPYYIHHPDLTEGTCHFRLPLNEGLNIMKSLRGHISGMCLPYYMIDLPGGGGKIPLTPEYVKGMKNNKLQVENFKGEIFEYPDV